MIVKKYTHECNPIFGLFSFTSYYIDNYKISISIRNDNEVFINSKNNVDKEKTENVELDDIIVEKCYQIFLAEQKLSADKKILRDEIKKMNTVNKCVADNFFDID